MEKLQPRRNPEEKKKRSDRNSNAGPQDDKICNLMLYHSFWG